MKLDLYKRKRKKKALKHYPHVFSVFLVVMPKKSFIEKKKCHIFKDKLFL